MRVLIVEEGTRAELDIDRPVVRIGRAVDNDIRLASKLVSRHHCRLERDAEGTWVVDEGSANGIQLNGERVRRAPLGPGDEVVLGGARLRVLDSEHATAAVTERADEGGAEDAGGEREGLSAVGFTTQPGEPLQERENLRVFAQIQRALVRETEVMPLLRLIVDSAVGLVGAERGFLLLTERRAGSRAEPPARPDPSTMSVRVARRFDKSDVPIPSSRLSMGIAGHVLQSGRPVLSVDAGHDDRFSSMASVEDLKLRSVLSIPIRIEGRVQGVVYLDNRLQEGAFTEDDLDLVELLGDQASIAIRNARLLAELRERNRRLVESRTQIERLNEQLGRKVRDRDTELAVVRAELERERGRYDYGSIVAASDGMRTVFQRLDRIIETDLPVLIRGESGTGKELIARAVHYNGVRKDRPFVTENCAALPDSLLESELFGHVRGAFTGADRSKKGLIEQADGGTLFLDEIGDMSPEMQKKLLRVLQEGEVRPLGSSQVAKVDVRIIAASNRDLLELVGRSEFREDLYYRVNVLSVELPPLRERREDVPLLAEHLLARAARESGRAVPHLPHEVIAALVAYDWPGNVRELENEMRRLVVLAGEAIDLDLLSPAIQSSRGAPESPAVGGESLESLLSVGGDLRATVARFEQRAIESALGRAGGNKSRAASELGISRFALQRKLEKYGLTVDGDAVTPANGDGSSE